MKHFSLNGSWQLQQAGQSESVSAVVPGCVHIDLLTAGHIPDPFDRDNELAVLWVGEATWIYRRCLPLPADFLNHDRVLLRCHGLDTLASLTLNGQEIAHTDNMFRIWELDVKRFLRAGDNEIAVRFDSALRYGQARLAERYVHNWRSGGNLPGGNYVRKEQCSFGWDWGPRLATCGIWRDMELIAFDTARLADFHILQDHTQPGPVILTCRAAVERARDTSLTVEFVVTLAGALVAHETVTLASETAEAHLTVVNPQLWWPNGLGAQPLYEVKVTLTDASGDQLDAITRRIGLRTLRLDRHRDALGESFQFVVNGVPFFAKGANWIPADAFLTRISHEQYRQLLSDAAAAHMNMLRVWGGGIYEADVFYDLCDELGLCVWQDFAFACAAYPTFDPDFMATVEQEARDNIRRLRHHACLALWCGNNELEQGLVSDEWTDHTMSWADYGRLFDQLLPQLVAQLDPETDYWPASPHTPVGDRHDWKSPYSGDAHVWDIWHGKQPFDFYLTCHHRFVSEFGFQSFPEPRTCYAFTAPQDRNITSYVMEHHQRSGKGNSTIVHYLLDWFRLPTSFEMTLWLSQILQGIGVKIAVEHWRRTMPRTMGTLYWQLNDCWPVASWSSLDYHGRWKALHYMARRFYAPLLISGVEDLSAGTVDIHVTSDRPAPCTGEAVWELTTVNGALLERGACAIAIPAGQDTPVETLNLQTYLQQHGARSLLLWLDLAVDGAGVSSNLVLLARPKHLDLAAPTLMTDATQVAGSRFDVTLAADTPALWTWLTLAGYEARFSDNFFHLRPGQPATVSLTLANEISLSDLRQALRVHSLVSTYA